MTKLLFIEASPRDGASASTLAARHFLGALQSRHPGLAIDHLDLWTEALPEFDGAALAAKYARLAKREHRGDEADAWQIIAAMVGRIASADAVLIATPMWNFSIPYKLKHWIDLVTQPGLSFSFDPQKGYTPLLTPRPTLVIVASSGDYSAGASFGRPDLATPYLNAALRFLGLGEPTILGIGPTAGPVEAVDSARAEAEQRLTAIAAEFLPIAAQVRS